MQPCNDWWFENSNLVVFVFSINLRWMAVIAGRAQDAPLPPKGISLQGS